MASNSGHNISLHPSSFNLLLLLLLDDDDDDDDQPAIVHLPTSPWFRQVSLTQFIIFFIQGVAWLQQMHLLIYSKLRAKEIFLEQSANNQTLLFIFYFLAKLSLIAATIRGSYYDRHNRCNDITLNHALIKHC